jgi:hypothetical protein
MRSYEMFLVKAKTAIQVQVPKHLRDFISWMPYETKEDKFYENHEVWDLVRLHNHPEEVPEWIRRNIELGYYVFERHGKFALVSPSKTEYVD